MLPPPSTAYVWFDTEYSGLELEKAVLLQVALVLTDASLQPLDPQRDDPNFYVRLPADAEVSPWIRENMPDVLARCAGPEALTVEEIDARLADYVSRHVVLPAGEDKRRPILAGNSVHSDWYLARKFLPRFMKLLHYRHLDVTALKIQWQDGYHGGEFDKDDTATMKRYFPDARIGGVGRRHDALYDAQASIAELAYYRERLLLPPGAAPQPLQPADPDDEQPPAE